MAAVLAFGITPVAAGEDGSNNRGAGIMDLTGATFRIGATDPIGAADPIGVTDPIGIMLAGIIATLGTMGAGITGAGTTADEY